jgi:hypothetical protein
MNEIAQGGDLPPHLMLGLLIMANAIVAWLIWRKPSPPAASSIARSVPSAPAKSDRHE